MPGAFLAETTHTRALIHFGARQQREKKMRHAATNKRAERVNVEAICRPLAADYFFGIAIK
jgi:hypothetical protein